MINFLLMILFGALVGWLAGLIMKTRKNLLKNILCGIGGSIVGGWIGSLIGISSFCGQFNFSINNILVSIAGACLIIWIVQQIKR